MRSKLEAKFAIEILIPSLAAGTILSWKYEALRFSLPGGVKYTPDFQVVDSATLEITIYEVKGLWRPRDRVVVKSAAYAHPEYHFIGAQFDNKKKCWVFEPFPVKGVLTEAPRIGG